MLFVWVAREKEERRKLGDGRKRERVAFAEGQCDMSPAPPGLAAPTDFGKSGTISFFDPLRKKGKKRASR